MLVVLGGSSPWTAALLPLLERERVVLVGRDRGALEALVAYAQQRTSATVTASTNPTAALQKASIVVCQVRFGGWQARYNDEWQPRRWNAYGDETLGIGGLRGALRASRTISKWAQIAHGVPAIIVTNPTDLITRQWASLSRGMCVSACEVPSLLLQQLPGDALYLGVNHAGCAELADGSRYRTRWLSMLPHLAAEVASQRRSLPARPRIVADLSRRLRRALARRDYATVEQILKLRPAHWYNRIIVPLVRGLYYGSAFRDVVGMANGCRLPSVSCDVIVESLSSADGPVADAVPASLVGEISALAHARDHAWRFLERRDLKSLRSYLDADPFARGAPASASLLQWLMEADSAE